MYTFSKFKSRRLAVIKVDLAGGLPFATYNFPSDAIIVHLTNDNVMQYM